MAAKNEEKRIAGLQRRQQYQRGGGTRENSSKQKGQLPPARKDTSEAPSKQPTRDTLPRTETEMYTLFTRSTLLRASRLEEGNEMVHIESPHDLPDSEREVFFRICKLGFEKTVSSKQVMRKSEVRDFFRDVHCGKESMGLITVDCMARVCGFENLYTFLHLTFQEYLAAYHVFKLSEAEQIELLRKYGKKTHMQVVWKFYCGLVKFEEESIEKFHEVLKFAKKDDLFGVQCAFESQQSTTCDHVVQSGEQGALSFKGHFLSPSDLAAIGFVLKKTTGLVTKLVLDRCTLQIEGINAFHSEAGSRILSVKTLCFHGKACVMEQYQLLNSCLQEMNSIEVFDITNTHLGIKKRGELTKSLTLPNLRTLKVSHLQYVDERILFNSSKLENIVVPGFSSRAIKDHLTKVLGPSTALILRSMSSVKYVHLQGITLQVTEIKLVTEAIKQEACCTSLYLTDCDIDDSVCKALANGLVGCRTLRQLVLCNNRIDIEGLAEVFTCCTQITSLDITRNCISDARSNITAIAESMKNCTNLQKLNVSYNNFGDAGAAALAHCLKHLINIRTLSMRCTGIGDAGARSLAEVSTGTNALLIERCVNLDMSYNHIGDIGAVAVAESLRYSTSLRELNLTGNKIGDEGAMAIIRATIARKGLQLHIANHRITENFSTSMNQGNCHILDINSNMLEEAEALKFNFQDDTGQFNNISEIKLHISDLKTETLAAVVKCCYELKILNITFMNSICSAKILEEILFCPSSNLQLISKFQNCSVCKLQTLSLWNSIGNDGSKVLAEGLQNCKNIQTLNLEGNNILADGAKALAVGLQHCNNLQTLNLEGNNIGADGAKALAEGLRHCNKLQTLNLRVNGIGDNGAKALAVGLQHCNNMQTLNLEGNNIGADGAEALAEGLQHYNKLQTLNLTANNIGDDGAKALAEGLQHCNNLQTLKVQCNSIGADGAKALAEGLQHCNNLQTLNLEQNIIGDDSVKALVDGLQHCNNLRTLNLVWNKIDDDGAKAFAEGLQHCNNLQELNLGRNDIGADGAKALAEGLQHCNNLQTLNLERNIIGDDGAKVLAEGLQHCSNLQTLNLNVNNIGDDGTRALAEGLQHCNNLQTLSLNVNKIGDDGAKALAEGVQHCNNLQELNLKRNNIGADGAKALAEVLQHCNNLQELNLGRNDICADGVKALAERLQHCNNLQTLKLQWNSIGADGAKALAEGLQHCNNLQTLNLDWNNIGADGAKALAEGLQHCNNLQTLNLDMNNVGADGAKALAEGLQHCNNLQTLNLEWNKIGEYGTKALAEGLQHCNNLKTLNLAWNNIGADGAKALAEGLQHCNSLKTLNLERNNIGADGAKALAEGLQHCNNLKT